jgi:protease-4
VTPRLRYFETEPGRLQRLLKRFGLQEAQVAWVSAWTSALLDPPAAAEGAALAGTAASLAGAGWAAPELAATLAADLGWLAEVAARQRPFAAATHCLCGAP